MQLDFTALSANEAYRWLTATVTPRPIAWVSTRSLAGVDNLAPFSFFQVVADAPQLGFVGQPPLAVGDASGLGPHQLGRSVLVQFT